MKANKLGIFFFIFKNILEKEKLDKKLRINLLKIFKENVDKKNKLISFLP